MRNCEICRSKEYIDLYSQPYVIPGNSNPVRHHVVACASCGFVYVRKVAFCENLDEYYKNKNKYSNSALLKQKPPTISKFHQDAFVFLKTYISSISLPKSTKILDVGSSTGSLLSLFKKAGFYNIEGIDPAETSATLAKQWWDVLVSTNNLLHYQPSGKFDVVILCAVLEHLESLRQSVRILKKLLKPNGILFVSVPDLVHFGQPVIEPNLEFSFEHINFFTSGSLSNLFGEFGFVKKAEFSHLTDSFGSIALDTIWQMTNTKQKIRFESKGINAINKYVSQSLSVLSKMERKFQKMNKERSIAIWGAGSACARLLATTSLRTMPIAFFIDTNPALHSQKMLGKYIYPPKQLLKNKIPVLVTSVLHKDEIIKILKEEYAYENHMILTL